MTFVGSTPTDRVLDEVSAERDRQEEICTRKRSEGKDWMSCADPRNNDEYRLAVLGEEFGEVCREVCEARSNGVQSDNMREELIQLAAVAVAWAEAL